MLPNAIARNRQPLSAGRIVAKTRPVLFNFMEVTQTVPDTKIW
jgi:hypothetical protein